MPTARHVPRGAERLAMLKRDDEQDRPSRQRDEDAAHAPPQGRPARVAPIMSVGASAIFRSSMPISLIASRQPGWRARGPTSQLAVRPCAPPATVPSLRTSRCSRPPGGLCSDRPRNRRRRDRRVRSERASPAPWKPSQITPRRYHVSEGARQSRSRAAGNGAAPTAGERPKPSSPCLPRLPPLEPPSGRRCGYVCCNHGECDIANAWRCNHHKPRFHSSLQQR
jgi:hypothetical protein